MAYSLPSRLSAVFFLGVMLLMSGCCANKVCDCPNEQGDTIKMLFDPTKFSPADLDTLVIQRYPLVITRSTRPETVTIFRTTLSSQVSDTLVINNGTPFAQVGASKLDQYQYYVRYYPSPRSGRSTIVLAIDKIALQGSFDGNGCCTCYNNTKKIVTTRRDSTASTITAIETNLKQKRVLLIEK